MSEDMIRYEAVLYRDTATDAAVEQHVLSQWYHSPEAAIADVRGCFDEEWTSATIHEGTVDKQLVNGREQYVFEDGEAVRWYVGPDYADREETA